MTKINTAINLSLRRKLLFLSNLVLSLYCFLSMRFFPKSARLKTGKSNEGVSDINFIRDLKWAIVTVEKYVPWPNVCRHQAYQVAIICRIFNLPYEVYIGFKKDIRSGKVIAHAWTLSDNIMVSGHCNPKEYVLQKHER